MKDYDVTYEWLDYIHTKKYGNHNILKEQLNTDGAGSIVERASSAYHKGWVYQLGGFPNPSQILAGATGVPSDCGGYIRWASGVSNFVRVNSDNYGPRIINPEIGCAIWYDPIPGNQYGHGGIVTQVYSDGNFDTLDCGSSANDQGAIRKIIKASCHHKKSQSFFDFNHPHPRFWQKV